MVIIIIIHLYHFRSVRTDPLVVVVPTAANLPLPQHLGGHLIRVGLLQYHHRHRLHLHLLNIAAPTLITGARRRRFMFHNNEDHLLRPMPHRMGRYLPTYQHTRDHHHLKIIILILKKHNTNHSTIQFCNYFALSGASGK